MQQSFFWETLTPIKNGGGVFPTSGPLADAIKADFGGLDGLKSSLNAAALGIQGSGWAWLVSVFFSIRINVVTDDELI